MAIDQRRAIVRVASLIATEPFQSEETTRYYLNGTCILPRDNGVILTATDGHTMIALREPDGYASGLKTIWNCAAKKRLGNLLAAFRKPVKPGRKLAASSKPRELWADLQYGNPGGPTLSVKIAADAAEIVNGGGETKAMFIDSALFVDGTFPDIEHLFARQLTATDKPVWGGPFAVQPVYLERLAALAKALGATSQPSACFGATGPDSAITVTIGDRPNVVCLVMPMRMGEDDAPLVPRWILLPRAPDAVVEQTEQEPVAEAA